LEIVSVENCSEKKLDLVYRIYSTQIMPVLSGAPEAREIEKTTPQTTAGQTTVVIPNVKPFHFTPLFGYDAENRLYGGGKLEILAKPHLAFPFGSVLLEGRGSSEMHAISARLFGSIDREVESTDASKGIAHAEWWLNFEHYALPTGAGQIKSGQLAAGFSGTSKPLGKGNITLKFGGLLEGGNRQSDLNGILLPPDTISNAGVGTLKLYGGLDSRLRHNVLSATYGLELGSEGPSARIDWKKQILDAQHQFWYSIGDHHLLDVDSHLTYGSISISGKIPLAERFFGGNNEEWFIPGDTWQIRANPVIRAIPGNRFFRTATGAGAKQFVSYNLTAAYGIFRKPIVPPELSNDPEFNSELDGAITTVTNTLQNYYSSKDSRFAQVVNDLPALRLRLEGLKSVVETSQSAHADQPEELFKACLKSIRNAMRRVDGAINPVRVINMVLFVRCFPTTQMRFSF
jgi:hypothetical protein